MCPYEETRPIKLLQVVSDLNSSSCRLTLRQQQQTQREYLYTTPRYISALGRLMTWITGAVMHER
jgi:hypothetical protein